VYNTLPPSAQAYSDRIREMGERVVIVVQESQVSLRVRLCLFPLPVTASAVRAIVYTTVSWTRVLHSSCVKLGATAPPHTVVVSRPLDSVQKHHRRALSVHERLLLPSFLCMPFAQEGFGHAVLTARSVVGDEPFLLMLGDHLYKTSHPTRTCVDQVLAAFDGSSSVIGTCVINERDVGEVVCLSRSLGSRVRCFLSNVQAWSSCVEETSGYRRTAWAGDREGRFEGYYCFGGCAARIAWLCI
jgi:hypothetical protein